MRSIALSTIVLVLAAQVGCARTASDRKWGAIWTVSGTAIAVAGGALAWSASHPDLDTDDDGMNDFPDNDVSCLVGGCLLGAAMAVTGVLLAGYGVLRITGVVRGQSASTTPLVPPWTIGPRRPAPPVAASVHRR